MAEMYRGTPVVNALPGMLDFLKLWASNTTKLWAVHILLGVVGTFFSLLTAAAIPTMPLYSQVFAFIAALSISMMTAFNLGTKSNNTRNAWRKLNAAMMKYNQNIVNKEYVIRAYEEGESLIGGVTFSQTGIQYDELRGEHSESTEDKDHNQHTTEDKDHNQPSTNSGAGPAA